MKYRIAIIGGGFFGCLCSLKLTEIKNVYIDLYEKKEDILLSASGKNQMRAHVGYHYPRSKETVKEVQKSTKKFDLFFPKNVFEKTKNVYAIANNRTKTNSIQYVDFLKKNNLYFKNLKKFHFVEKKNIDSVFLVKEKILNIFNARKFLKRKISNNKKIKLFLNTKFSKSMIDNYDKIVYASYEENNSNIKGLTKNIEKKRYELVEKILVKMPSIFSKTSIVILDGNFVCIDPYLGTNLHLLSDVKNSKIEVQNKKFIKFTNYKKKYLGKQLIKNIKVSLFKKFIKNSKKYLPILTKAKYHGSFFVVRTIDYNKNDTRKTEIKKLSEKIFTIHGGKWITAVSTAIKLKLQIKRILK
jgi:hypothetical protein